MDKRNRVFFNILNSVDRDNEIDINNFSLDDLMRQYEKFILKIYNFLGKQREVLEKEKTKEQLEISKKQVGKSRERIKQLKEQIEKSKEQIKRFNKMFKFWTNPFHIATRNEIGKTGIPKQKVEQSILGQGEKVLLTKETINEIESRYIPKAEITTYNVDSNNYEKGLSDIIKELLKKQEKEEIKVEVEVGDKRPIDEIEQYTYDSTLVKNCVIKKYKVVFEQEGVEHIKQIYGTIDLDRFYQDNAYKRVVLETIEDLEIGNYWSQTNNNYIGMLHSCVKDGRQIWQQAIKQTDIEAIQKIETTEQKCIEIAKQKEIKSTRREGR